MLVPSTKSEKIGKHPEREEPKENQERMKFEVCIRQPGKDNKYYLVV